MFPNERESLEEELTYLKKILDFYVEFKRDVVSMSDDELENHINDILERILEIKKHLEHD